ncbi:MAG: hypothetical protein ACOC8F_04280 [Planctomycetota bacterium]
MGAWNGWYHVNGSTYGTWLRGDPRGWRACHHREHVEGDYRNPPPPGTYDELHRRSGELLKRGPIRLTPQQRRAAGRAMVGKLLALDTDTLAVAVGAAHYHILARFRDDRVRWWVGWAKKHASHALTPQGSQGASGHGDARTTRQEPLTPGADAELRCKPRPRRSVGMDVSRR